MEWFQQKINLKFKIAVVEFSKHQYILYILVFWLDNSCYRDLLTDRYIKKYKVWMDTKNADADHYKFVIHFCPWILFVRKRTFIYHPYICWLFWSTSIDISKYFCRNGISLHSCALLKASNIKCLKISWE